MKIFAKVAYKGTNYQGWQKQTNVATIQEELEKVLSKILNSETVIYGSGRTDSGVHALGQTFHFEVNKVVELSKLRYSINCLLPKDIHVLELREVSSDFHARFSAKGKHYQYLIHLGENDPFSNEMIYNYLGTFDLEKFQEAIKMFVGKHNFKNFTSKEEDESNFTREIFKIEIEENKNIIKVDLYGEGFMRYMIRYIVGTCIAIAENREDISFIKEKLMSDNREIVHYKAPSQGLYLHEVIY